MFQAITLDEQEMIRSFTFEAQCQTCDWAFANLFSWAERYQTSWSRYEDSLLIRFYPKADGLEAFLFPLSPNEEQLSRAVDYLIKRAEAQASSLRFMSLSQDNQATLKRLFPQKFEFFEERSAYDYLYERERLCSFSGKKLQAKRNHVNKFKKLYPNYHVELLDETNASLCLSLAEAWFETAPSRLGVAEELQMIQRMLRHHTKLSILGVLLFVGECLVAFSLGSPISKQMFCVHVEKASKEYAGAFSMISQVFAQHVPTDYLYLNREEDLGLEGLRKSKRSYAPIRLLEKDIAILKN